MAFVRRHRMVLVPLCVAVVAAVGALVLGPSGSEEPADDSPDGATVTVHPWQELVERRSDHVREWRVVREIERVDPETGQTVTDEVVSTVREVASNLCYRDAEGSWQPSVAEWEATGDGFKSDRNGYQVYFGATLGASYTKIVSGKQFWMCPRSLVLSDGAHVLLVAAIDPNAVGHVDANDPAKLVFPDAFGEALDAELEYVLEKASFHQNVVLRSAIALPDCFDAEAAQLHVFTEVGLDYALADNTVSVQYAGAEVAADLDGSLTPFSKREPIAFLRSEVGATGELVTSDLFAFAASRVYDSAAEAVNETLAERRLWRDPTDQKIYLVERVSHSWLAAATYPVTLDYEDKSGNINNEEWRADATYYVSNNVNVGSEKTLTIEPGTVIKFASGSAINVTNEGAKILAQGEPFRYIVFTSKNDDDSGDEISGSSGNPVASDYDDAVNIGASASADCAIEYCKIGYASDAIEVDKDIGAIKHCIIRDCGDAMVFAGSSAPDLFNCLIADIGGYGVTVAPYDAQVELEITNCTFDDCGYGISLIAGPTASIDLTAKNNLFANNTIGVCNSGQGTCTLDYNGWYGNTTDTVGTSKGNDAVTMTVSPYNHNTGSGSYPDNPCPLGDHYIDTEYEPGGGKPPQPPPPSGYLLVDAGDGTADSHYGDGGDFDFEPPETVDGDITSNTTWSPGDGDTSTVDIGYHQPRIDKLIDNTARKIGSGVTLTIQSGVAVAFHNTGARLEFDSSGASDRSLACDGTPSEPIILAGGPVVSMHVEAQYYDDPLTYDIKGLRLNDPTSATATASITYTRLMGLHKAILIEKDSDNEIKHCIFERGRESLYGEGAADREVSVSNCLFRYSHRGVCIDMNDSATLWSFHNCTFDRNDIGMVLWSGSTATVNIKDCLFSNADEGIRLNDMPTTFTHDYNAFNKCDPTNNKKIWKNYGGTPAEESIGANSYALASSPYDSAAEWSWADLWYLDQDGDFVGGGSRTALAANLATFTTRLSDYDYDYGQVDIGYHYPTGLDITDTHFDNEASGEAGEIDILYDYGGNVSYRTIRIYNSDGELVYEYAPSGEGTYIRLTGWDGKGNQSGYNGQDLDTGTYTVVVTGGAQGNEYARFHLYIEQSSEASLEIQRPDDNETVDWL